MTKKLKIVIIENNLGHIELLKINLQQKNYETLISENSDPGIFFARE